MNKWRDILSDLSYVFVWSLGLAYASFRPFFEGTKDFVFKDMMLAEAIEIYIFPLITSMLLFLIDSIYTMSKIKWKKRTILGHKNGGFRSFFSPYAMAAQN